MPPACHSLPRRRFASLRGEGLYAAGFNIPLSIFNFQFSIETKPAENVSKRIIRITIRVPSSGSCGPTFPSRGKAYTPPVSIFHFPFSIEKKPAEASIKAVRISEIIFFIFNNPSG
jgi:hypothetical protein